MDEVPPDVPTRGPKGWRKFPPRTAEQEFADTFDCDLYLLLRRAETMADKQGAAQQRWIDAARSLRMARALLRDLMHPTDRTRIS